MCYCQVILRVFERLASADNAAMVLVPHLLPILRCSPSQRVKYAANATATPRAASGISATATSSPSSAPPPLAHNTPASSAAAPLSGAHPGQGEGDPDAGQHGVGLGEEEGYWDLVHSLYRLACLGGV